MITAKCCLSGSSDFNGALEFHMCKHRPLVAQCQWRLLLYICIYKYIGPYIYIFFFWYIYICVCVPNWSLNNGQIRCKKNQSRKQLDWRPLTAFPLTTVPRPHLPWIEPRMARIDVTPQQPPTGSTSFSSWWLNQPIWKICSSKWVHLPQFSGWK